jgi:hypothetical protein
VRVSAAQLATTGHTACCRLLSRRGGVLLGLSCQCGLLGRLLSGRSRLLSHVLLIGRSGLSRLGLLGRRRFLSRHGVFLIGFSCRCGLLGRLLNGRSRLLGHGLHSGRSRFYHLGLLGRRRLLFRAADPRRGH